MYPVLYQFLFKILLFKMYSTETLITIKFEIKKHKPAQPEIKIHELSRLINEYFERRSLIINKISIANGVMSMILDEKIYEEIPHIIDFAEIKVCLLLLDPREVFFIINFLYLINFT